VAGIVAAGSTAAVVFRRRGRATGAPPANAERIVKRWLEDVMAASQLRAGYHLDLVQDEVPTDPSSIRLPTFVAYRWLHGRV